MSTDETKRILQKRSSLYRMAGNIASGMMKWDSDVLARSAVSFAEEIMTEIDKRHPLDVTPPSSVPNDQLRKELDEVTNAHLPRHLLDALVVYCTKLKKAGRLEGASEMRATIVQRLKKHHLAATAGELEANVSLPEYP